MYLLYICGLDIIIVTFSCGNIIIDNTICTLCVNLPVSFGKGAELECSKM